MDRKSVVLIWCITLLTIVTVIATFYRTVILEDYKVTGYGVLVEPSYTYAYFVHNGEEYEVETESENFDELLLQIAHTLEIQSNQVDVELVSELRSLHQEALAELNI